MNSKFPSCRSRGRRVGPGKISHMKPRTGTRPQEVFLQGSSFSSLPGPPTPKGMAINPANPEQPVHQALLAWGERHIEERRQGPCPHRAASKSHLLLQRLGMWTSISLISLSRVGRDLSTQVFHSSQLRASDGPDGKEGNDN